MILFYFFTHTQTQTQTSRQFISNCYCCKNQQQKNHKIDKNFLFIFIKISIIVKQIVLFAYLLLYIINKKSNKYSIRIA